MTADENRALGRRDSDREIVAEVQRHRRARGVFDRLLPAIIAGIVVLLLVDTVLSVAVFRANGELRQQDRERKAAISGSCERLQRVRDDVNAQAAAMYRVLEPLGHRPGSFAPVAAAIADGTMYLPPTDCSLAVEHPGGYRAPEAIPFRLVAPCYDAKTYPRPEAPCRTP